MNGTIFGELADSLPRCAGEIQRLKTLSLKEESPTVVVLGKYNHGKSSLLNALLCRERFHVSDIRETVEVDSEEFEGVRWMDTPGLDADVAGEDDRKALNAARDDSDVRLMVHHLRQGELDAAELKLAQSLLADMKTLGRPALLILTKCEELDSAQLLHVMETIKGQLPGMQMIAVSAECYVRGFKGNKPRLIESSNFGELQAFLQTSLKDVLMNRKSEKQKLIEMILSELENDNQICRDRIRDHQQRKRDAYRSFADEFRRLRIRIYNKFKDA